MFVDNATTIFQAKVGDVRSRNYVFRCELNDAFGLILQGILAFTAFCILIRELFLITKYLIDFWY